jgi:hypothetical protein
LRDDHGGFVLIKTMSFSHMSYVVVGEALGLFYVLESMHDMQFDNIDFVVDFKITTDVFYTRRIYVT